ncbi:MAG: dTMP kinase, partial [Methanobacteriota archaeon]
MHLIALVGADGMGKSTQARKLTERLVAAGRRARVVRPVFLLFNPWRIRKDGRPIRAVSPRALRVDARRMGALRPLVGYIYAVLAYAYIRAFLRRDDFIVCDRYFYQYFHDLAGRAAPGLARAFPRPDVTVWLDGGIEILVSRIDGASLEPREREYFKGVLEFHR